MGMTAIHLVRMAAGFFVLLSMALGMEGSPLFLDANWQWLAVFIGANLFQSAFTKICPLEIVLKAAGIE
jgi:hypothetical protein